jgi:hypothetical protein
LIFGAELQDPKVFFWNQDVLNLFIERDLYFETATDVSSAISGDYENFSYISKYLNTIINSPGFNDSHKECLIDCISMMDDNNEKQTFLDALGVDLLEEISKYCLNSSHNPNLNMNFYDNEFIEKLIGLPFLYNTHREFILYAEAKSYNFMLKMIENGYEPNFLAREIDSSTLATLFTLVKDHGIPAEIFPNLDFSDHFVRLGDLSFDETIGKMISNKNLCNINTLIKKFGAKLFVEKYDSFTKLLTETATDVAELEIIMVTMIDFLLINHVDFCWDLIKNLSSEEKAQEILQKNLTKFAIKILISKLYPETNNEQFALHKNNISFDKIKDLFLHYSVSKNIDLLELASRVLPNIDMYVSAMLLDALTEMFGTNIQALSNFSVKNTTIITKIMIKSFTCQRSYQHSFTIKDFVELYFGEDAGKDINFIKEYVCGIPFNKKTDALEFYSQVNNFVQLDQILLDMIATQDISTLDRYTLFKNKYLCEYILDLVLSKEHR